jgi:D-alanyl-lipoteichoic acid acyltransferase DltB (MBOAT superfamily)
MVFKPYYILILLLIIVIDYYSGIKIEESEKSKKRAYLSLSLLANIGILVVFKYYNFINFNIAEVLSLVSVSNPLPMMDILLPIGLSFHTFQAMSYTIEVYRGKQSAEKNFLNYSLYVLYYPQLVAGPIERPQNLLHQFREEHKFDYNLVNSGLKLMAIGFFKKVVIADRLSIAVDYVYNDVSQFNSVSHALASIFFAFQIYYDFSGYSDIAIGASMVMGIKLMKNFNNPYHATSISEFWSRWHISLTSWFKEYVYISMGGSRVGKVRTSMNLLIVFCLSGLWHGANYTFIIWGLLNGLFLVLAKVKNELLEKWNIKFSMPKILKVLIVFILVDTTWIFFRANNIREALEVVRSIYLNLASDVYSLVAEGTQLQYIGMKSNMIVLSMILIITFELLSYFEDKYKLTELLSAQNLIVRYFVYYLLILAIIFLGVFENRSFIYFQF